MFYRARGPGIYDGGATVRVDQYPDHYEVHFQLSVRIGTKVFGRFVGKTIENSGSVRIPLEMLTEQKLQDPAFTSASFGKVNFTKQSPNRWNFAAGAVGGSVNLSFDGLDPVQVDSVECPTFGMTLSL